MALISGRKEKKQFEELQILWIYTVYTVRLCGMGLELPVMDTRYDDIHRRNYISDYIPE
jgi:hypothetical protein